MTCICYHFLELVLKTNCICLSVKTSQASNSSLKTYIHQHVWLLFTSLTLSLRDVVYGSDPQAAFMDSDYIRTAGVLQVGTIFLLRQPIFYCIPVFFRGHVIFVLEQFYFYISWIFIFVDLRLSLEIWHQNKV